MVLGWKSYHHHLTDKYTEVWWGWRIGEKLHKQVNDGRSRSGEESVSGVVWFAALYQLPLFLREYLSFYFSMTFFLYCGKIHITQSSLAWALYHVNSMILSTFTPLWNHHHHRLQEILSVPSVPPGACGLSGQSRGGTLGAQIPPMSCPLGFTVSLTTIKGSRMFAYNWRNAFFL